MVKVTWTKNFHRPINIGENQNKPSAKIKQTIGEWKTTCPKVSLLWSCNGGNQIDYGLCGNREHWRSKQPKTNPVKKSKIKNPHEIGKNKGLCRRACNLPSETATTQRTYALMVMRQKMPI